jgi:hypothetical protein
MMPVREVLLGIRTVAEMAEAFHDEEECRRLLEVMREILRTFGAGISCVRSARFVISGQLVLRRELPALIGSDRPLASSWERRT